MGSLIVAPCLCLFDRSFASLRPRFALLRPLCFWLWFAFLRCPSLFLFSGVLLSVPGKQHLEFQLAVKIVEEREQQRISGGEASGRKSKHIIFIVIVSMGWLVGEFVVGQIVGLERISPRSKKMIHQRRTPGWGVIIPSFLAHAFSSYIHSNISWSRLWHLFSVFAAQTFLVLCDWCIAVALRIATAVLGKKSRCVHTTIIHCAHHSLRGFVATEDIHLLHILA